MTTSVSSRQAPFLKFADSVPEWTTIQDNGSKEEEHRNTVVASSEPSFVGGSQWPESLSATTGNERGASVCCNDSQPALEPPTFFQQAKLLPHFKHYETQILSDFQDKKIYIFLDYDGTLTPIVPDPAQAFLSDNMRNILLNLANSNQVIVGIVTGRALSSIKRFVQITASEQLKFLYAASHGFHIEAAGQELHHKVGASYIPILREAALKISRALGHVPALILEDNEFSVSVHYRNSPPECVSEVESTIDFVLSSYPSLRKTKGKMVFELRINLSWDKGRAVMWLLHAMNVNPEDPNVRLVYIGDDVTDEDAFKVIRQYGAGHLALLVSDTNSRTQSTSCHRSTAASFIVEGVDEVADFLISIHRASSRCPSACLCAEIK